MKARCQTCNETYEMENLIVDYFANEKEKTTLYGLKLAEEPNKNIEINKITCPKCGAESTIYINILNFNGDNILERILNEIKQKSTISSNIPNFDFFEEEEK